MRVAVIGGGVTGLVAGLRLQDSGVDTTLFEGSERLGGKIHTIPLGHAHIEEGPDAMLPRSPHPMRLLERIGLAGDVVSPAVFGAVVRWGRELHPVPPGTFLGVPVTTKAVLGASMLSPAGKARALVELLHRRPLGGEDVSVASFVARRYGKEVLERLVDPLLAGTRAGDAREMSLAAAAREVDALARSRPSLLRGGPALPPSASVSVDGGTSGFIAPRGGMTQMIDGLATAIDRVDVRLARRVEELAVDGRAVVVDGERFDAAIVTVPSRRSAPLLEPIAPDTARLLARIRHASSVVVNLAFPAGAVTLPPTGSGLLIPSRYARGLSAATWFTRKWPHVRPRDGREIVRLFAGRRADDPVLDLDDRDVVDRLVTDLERHVRVDTQPEVLSIRRWTDGLPLYDVGHLDRVAAIRRGLPPQVKVAGTDLDGTGIPDCIRQASRAVAEVLESRD